MGRAALRNINATNLCSKRDRHTVVDMLTQYLIREYGTKPSSFVKASMAHAIVTSFPFLKDPESPLGYVSPVHELLSLIYVTSGMAQITTFFWTDLWIDSYHSGHLLLGGALILRLSIHTSICPYPIDPIYKKVKFYEKFLFEPEAISYFKV